MLTRRRRTDPVFDLAFGPGDRQLAAGYLAGGVTIWHPVSGRPLTALGARDPGAVLALSFSPDGFTLAAGSSDGTAWLWDVATKSRVALGRLGPA
jgi:WD40 repeat protein